MATAISNMGALPCRKAVLPPATHSEAAPIMKHNTPSRSTLHSASSGLEALVTPCSVLNEAPSEPNEIAHVCPSDAMTNAASGGNPVPTSSGATTATGTP